MASEAVTLRARVGSAPVSHRLARLSGSYSGSFIGTHTAFQRLHAFYIILLQYAVATFAVQYTAMSITFASTPLHLHLSSFYTKKCN